MTEVEEKLHRLCHQFSSLPEEVDGKRLSLMFRQLHSQIHNSVDAIGLYCYLGGKAKKIYDEMEVGDQSENPEFKKSFLYVDWMKIPGRDLTFSVSHFDKMLSEIKGMHGRIPSLRGKVDAAALKLAHQRYRGHFPEAKAQRDFVGHMAEAASSAEATKGRNWTDNFDNGAYSCKIGNKTVNVPMKMESVDYMRKILDETMACFQACLDPEPPVEND